MNSRSRTPQCTCRAAQGAKHLLLCAAASASQIKICFPLRSHMILLQIDQQHIHICRRNSSDPRRLPDTFRPELLKLLAGLDSKALYIIIIDRLGYSFCFSFCELIYLSLLPGNISFVFDFNIYLFPNILRIIRSPGIGSSELIIRQFRSADQLAISIFFSFSRSFSISPSEMRPASYPYFLILRSALS